jgi:hypothetical protein
LTVVSGALLIAACSDGEPDGLTDSPTSSQRTDQTIEVSRDALADAPPCDEIFTEGAIIHAEDWPAACKKHSDSFLATGVYSCRDGRTLRANDLAWSYDEEPLTLGRFYDEELDKCLGG